MIPGDPGLFEGIPKRAKVSPEVTTAEGEKMWKPDMADDSSSSESEEAQPSAAPETTPEKEAA